MVRSRSAPTTVIVAALRSGRYQSRLAVHCVASITSVGGAGRKQAGFHPKKGTTNAVWLGGSGSAAIVPNSGTLRTIIETMKKSAKALRRWFGVGKAGRKLTFLPVIRCAVLSSIFLQSGALAAPLTFQQVSNAVQMAAAWHYPAKQSSPQRFSTPSGWSRRAVQRVDQLVHNGRTVAYVTHLTPSGYYLVPTDDQLPPWKLRSDEGDFDELPPALIQVLKLESAEDQEYLDTLRKLNKAPDPRFHKQWQSLLLTGGPGDGGPEPPTGSAGVFLLTTAWNQNAPYNEFCPTATGGSGGRAYAGCTACALAQILRYHMQSVAISGNYCYTDLEGNCQGTHCAADVGLTNYDWGNMPNSVTTTRFLRLSATQSPGSCTIALSYWTQTLKPGRLAVTRGMSPTACGLISTIPRALTNRKQTTQAPIGTHGSPGPLIRTCRCFTQCMNSLPMGA
jgi:hypothetical protein